MCVCPITREPTLTFQVAGSVKYIRPPSGVALSSDLRPVSVVSVQSHSPVALGKKVILVSIH